ncbi:MAG: hypothetical protein ACYC3I_26795 [Gemmataceae bacterium]
MRDDYPSGLAPWERLFVARWIVGLAAAVCVAGGTLLVLLFSGSTAPPTQRTSGPAQAPESGADTARQILSRQTDLETCRNALQQINAEISDKQSLHAPALTDEQKSWLHDNLSLSSEELSEVESSHFTRLDNYHLFRCLLLRDAANESIAVKGVRGKGGGSVMRDKPLDQAARAFAWVMREVRLRPSDSEETPPAFVLQRGWGTALERALVFLALLEQLGDPAALQSELLGFLLQIPPSIPPARGGDREGDGGRLWACGVVVGDGKDVYLFDPHLGLPLPGPKGEGIATLAQAREQPEVLAQLNVGAKYRYPVTMEQARTAQARMVCPFSALSPRMRYLQDKLLAPAVRVRLALDPVQDRERIKAAFSTGAALPLVPPARGGDKGGVLASKDLCTLLRRFLATDNGSANTPSREQLFWLGLVPWGDMPPVFQNERLFPRKTGLGLQVFNLFAHHFITPAKEPGFPRDLLLRGRYRSAMEKLVGERGDLRNQVEQLANTANMQEQFQKWLDSATDAYARQLRAKSPQERAQADRQVKALWEGRAGLPIYLILNGSAASARLAEVAYQLGLCSQEQAEQLQARLDLQARTGVEPDKRDVEKAWHSALDSWKRLEEDYPNHLDSAAARCLRGRAEAMLGDAQAALASWKAVAAWKDKPGTPTELERLACLYLAQHWEQQHAGKAK